MARIPNIFEQLFESGDTVTGVAYTGEATATQSDDGHIYRQTKSGSEAGAINGGLIPMNVNGGAGLYRLFGAAYISLPGCSNIDIRVVDPDTSKEFVVATAAAAEIVAQTTDSNSPLPPGWVIKVVATGTLTGDGKIWLSLDQWFYASPLAPMSG